MDVREVTINTNKDIALVLNKHTPEGQKLSYEQSSNFKTYLLAKFGKKFADNDNLTIWKVDFMNALNMCRAKDNWLQATSSSVTKSSKVCCRLYARSTKGLVLYVRKGRSI